MIKYLSIIGISYKNSDAYKFKLLFYSLTGIVSFYIYYSLWKSLYSNHNFFNGYSSSEIILYFVLSFVLQSILPRWISMEIGWKVKRGEITDVLLKPLDFKKYFLFYSFGDVIHTFIFMGLPLILFYLKTDTLLACANPAMFILSIIFSYVISFNLYYILGLMSFWLINIWGVFITFDLIYLFFSGAFIPLNFMPKQIQTLFNLLPFRAVVDIPISYWLRDGTDIKNLFFQIFWLLILTLLSKVIYKRARNKTDVYGG